MRIQINLYRNACLDVRQGLQFDVECVLSRLSATFPGLVFEDEYHKKWVGMFEKAVDAGEPGASGAMAIAKRDELELGPLYPFSLQQNGVTVLKGSIQRYRLSFKFTEHTAEGLRESARAFLRTFDIPMSECE